MHEPAEVFFVVQSFFDEGKWSRLIFETIFAVQKSTKCSKRSVIQHDAAVKAQR